MEYSKHLLFGFIFAKPGFFSCVIARRNFRKFNPISASQNRLTKLILLGYLESKVADFPNFRNKKKSSEIRIWGFQIVSPKKSKFQILKKKKLIF